MSFSEETRLFSKKGRLSQQPPPANTLRESANEECQDSHIESHPDELVTELHSHDNVGDIDAHRWYKLTKCMATLIVSLIATTVAFATAVSASVVTPVSKEFGVPEEVDTLATGKRQTRSRNATLLC
jgi:ABC-type Zn2+ transport system substrate-binding protein/surface adhesin